MSSKKENIKKITFSDDDIILHFADGRIVSTPLVFYPRLCHATPKQRAKWKIIGNNRGIHWPLVDEDLTIEGIIHGIPSVDYRRKPRRSTHTQDDLRV